jgi:hypothetical protein
MSNRGRHLILDEEKRSLILNLLESGCGRATAACAVNCHPNTIVNTAKRDPEFADCLALAERKAEIAHLENVNAAGSNPQHWRASAWFLERVIPEKYGKTNRAAVSQSDMAKLVTEVANIIVQEIPVALYRKQVLKRFDALLKQTRLLRISLPNPNYDLPVLEPPFDDDRPDPRDAQNASVDSASSPITRRPIEIDDWLEAEQTETEPSPLPSRPQNDCNADNYENDG